MKAIVIDEEHPERPLVYRDVPNPSVGKDDVLVAVHAAGTSRADLRKVGAHFAASDKNSSAVTGLEFAGEVVEIGTNVTDFRRGDRIMAFAGGANAEFAVVDHRLAMPIPRSFSWEMAAATPISFLTAFNAVVDAAKLRAGETILIQGGSASVGIAATQIARLKGAHRIFGTGSTDYKLERIRSFGCDVPINYRVNNVADVVKEETGGNGVDVVIDLIGGTTASVNVDAAAIKGRIVCVGRIDDMATINLNEFSRKRLHMIGVTFRTRSMDERIDIVRRFCFEMVPELEKGTIFPVIDRIFPVTEADKALAHIREHSHVGKVVLKIR